MQCRKIRIGDIDFTENSRSSGKDLSELMASIQSEGLKQPIVVCRNLGKGKKPYTLVAGNRRIGATKALGLKTIHALVDNTLKNRADFLITNLTENLQREDVSAYEVGRYVHMLNKEEKLSIEEIAVRLGKPQNKIAQLLNAYLKTPKEFRDKVVSDAMGKKVKVGYVPLSTAVKINNAKKANMITSPQATRLYKDSAAKVYQGNHIDHILKQVQNGLGFESALKSEKEFTHINIKFKVYADEIQELRDQNVSIHEFFASLIHGESKDYFTRP